MNGVGHNLTHDNSLVFIYVLRLQVHISILKDNQDILGKAQLPPADASSHISHLSL